MQKPAKYADIWVISTDSEMFCTECDDFVTPLIEVEVFGLGLVDVPEEDNVDYDETKGKPFCPDCGEEYTLFESESDAAAAAREQYDADRADAIRKGEW